MPGPDLFVLFTERLEHAGIPYVVTGSVASIVYGEPRVTLDIDLVVQIAPHSLEKFMAAFPAEEFYVPPLDAVREEVGRSERGHFSLLHHQTGFKADVYLPGSDPFQRWALEHPLRVDFRGHTLLIAPPEYVIVKKLEYYEEGGSEKHVRDIRAMLLLSRASIDQGIVERNLRSPKTRELWRQIATS
jgi:hypothetical protein